MRVRSINYWISQISAEKENPSNKTKQPANTEDLLNYQIAQYYVTKTETNTKSKVA